VVTVPDSEGLPPVVRRFIDQRIDNVEQLEILLLLYREASRYWDVAAVAQAVYLTERSAEGHLETLAGRNLLDVRLTESVLYRFSPAPPELTLDVKQLAESYRERRGELLALLAPRRRKSLQDFSDAFRISGGRKDG